MLPRVLEPEVMDSAEEARDYDSMDHSAVNQVFAERFLELIDLHKGSWPHPIRVLDVGTGTARIPIHICRLRTGFDFTAIDLADHMLALGARHVASYGFQDQIRLVKVDAKHLPFEREVFDAVISNSIIHHIPQPVVCLREMVRVLRPGGVLFIRDLLRPRNAEQVATILSKHAAGDNDLQRRLFEASLHAALTLPEVRQMLEEVGLPGDWATQSSDRHWTICSAP